MNRRTEKGRAVGRNGFRKPHTAPNPRQA
jgi:hypothetical protein